MIRRLVFACAAVLGCAVVIAATAGVLAAAPADRPGKSAPKSKPQSSPITTPIVFYAAKGQADACGPGCSEWIAAEGQFDLGAPQRLRTFLYQARRAQAADLLSVLGRAAGAGDGHRPAPARARDDRRGVANHPGRLRRSKR
ncbi:MAG: hypothetical protein ABWY47_09270 [Xanthobacteraceae bacterium]